MSATLLANRYRLERCIAIGGMGEVWRGSDLALSRTVAVKLLRDRYREDPAALARFGAEARCAGQVRHPGVVTIYDFGAADRPFLVMELVDGASLAQVLTRGPLTVSQTLDVVAKAAGALQAAHEVGILHRDLKPANLLVGPDGEIKLTDFGIAHSDDAGSGDAGSGAVGSRGTVLGTVAYLAPERLVGEPATVASDLYSLGVVMFECLTATRPFSGTLMQIAQAHQLRELPPLPATVPLEVRALVARLTSKDRSARPASAAVVGAEAAILRAAFAGSDHDQDWRDPGRLEQGLLEQGRLEQGRLDRSWLEQRKRRHAARRLPVAATLVDCPVS